MGTAVALCVGEGLEIEVALGVGEGLEIEVALGVGEGPEIEVALGVGKGVGVTTSPPQPISNIIVVYNSSDRMGLNVIYNSPIKAKGCFTHLFLSILL